MARASRQRVRDVLRPNSQDKSSPAAALWNSMSLCPKDRHSDWLDLDITWDDRNQSQSPLNLHLRVRVIKVYARIYVYSILYSHSCAIVKDVAVRGWKSVGRDGREVSFSARAVIRVTYMKRMIFPVRNYSNSTISSIINYPLPSPSACIRCSGLSCVLLGRVNDYVDQRLTHQFHSLWLYTTAYRPTRKLSSATSSRFLRSAHRLDLIFFRTWTAVAQHRVFAVVGPSIWNDFSHH